MTQLPDVPQDDTSVPISQGEPPDFMEQYRLALLAWHDECATCRQRYQGAGAVCKSCRDAEIRARELRERNHEVRTAAAAAIATLNPWVAWATFEKLAMHPGIHPDLLAVTLAWRRTQGCLVLLGPTGVGKSACMHSIAARVIRTVFETPGLPRADQDFLFGMRWYTASCLARARREHGLGRGDAPVVGEASSASLLLVDELGFEPDYGDRVVFDIFDRRYAGGLPTILTSGMGESELIGRYGPAFVRRLVEPGRIVSVHP